MNIKYHDPNNCNKRGGENTKKVVDSLDGYPLEYSTKCNTCGFTDGWAHG